MVNVFQPLVSASPSLKWGRWPQPSLPAQGGVRSMWSRSVGPGQSGTHLLKITLARPEAGAMANNVCLRKAPPRKPSSDR